MEGRWRKHWHADISIGDISISIKRNGENWGGSSLQAYKGCGIWGKLALHCMWARNVHPGTECNNWANFYQFVLKNDMFASCFHDATELASFSCCQIPVSKSACGQKVFWGDICVMLHGDVKRFCTFLSFSGATKLYHTVCSLDYSILGTFTRGYILLDC